MSFLGVLFQWILAFHNVIRWVIVILAVWTLFQAFSGWLSKRPWNRADRQSGLFLGIAIDIQTLLGLILAFRIPLTAWGTYLYEHIIPMVIAVIVVHIVSALVRRAASDPAKQRTAAIGYGLTVLIILISIPWMRPLLPHLG
jgi:hypothetical protein